MNVRESDYRASRKYRSANCRQINIELNKKLDEDVLVWLDSQENKQGYLKKLIREDMERQGFTLPEKKEE